MFEVLIPPAKIKCIGDEENKEVFEAAVTGHVTSTVKGTHDEHQPSSRFVFKHPRAFIRPSAFRER